MNDDGGVHILVENEPGRKADQVNRGNTAAAATDACKGIRPKTGPASAAALEIDDARKENALPDASAGLKFLKDAREPVRKRLDWTERLEALDRELDLCRQDIARIASCQGDTVAMVRAYLEHWNKRLTAMEAIVDTHSSCIRLAVESSESLVSMTRVVDGYLETMDSRLQGIESCIFLLLGLVILWVVKASFDAVRPMAEELGAV